MRCIMVLDDISANMALFVQPGKYGVINESYPIIMGYYVVKYVSVTFRLQDYIKK